MSNEVEEELRWKYELHMKENEKNLCRRQILQDMIVKTILGLTIFFGGAFLFIKLLELIK